MSDIRMAVIGDIHAQFDETDVRWFSNSDYDTVLVVGDLPGRTHAGTLKIAGLIARIEKPVYFMPGNHDGVSFVQLIAELKGNQALIEKAHSKQFTKTRQLQNALGNVAYCGYSLHAIEVRGRKFQLLAARPHSMGGPSFSYRPFLSAAFGVASFEDSAEKLKELLRRCTDPVLVLAHNGPTGLGSSRNDIFGCDFRKEEGDFGDPDLEEALRFAKEQNVRILAVAAGHMHHRIRGGGERITHLVRDNVHYLNAARVPRIWKEGKQEKRHHARIVLREDWSVECEQVVLP